MAKVRVNDLAKQMGIPAKDLLFKLQSLGVEVADSNAAIDHEVIMAILSGKKLASRPRAVIMREDKPQTEVAKKKEVRPPRPIVKPAPKREAPAPAAEPAQSGPAPVIAEFIQAAEAEAAEQERAAIEAAKAPKPKKAPAPAPAPVETAPEAPAPAAEAPAAPAPATPKKEPAAARPHHAPAASPASPATTPPASSEPPAHRPAAAAASDASRRPTGPTGPRARMAPAPRPNYQGQGQPLRPGIGPATRPMGNRPAGPGGPGGPGGGMGARGDRPQRPGGAGQDLRGGRPMGRPSGPGEGRPMGARPGGGPGLRPGGQRGAGGGLVPPPPAAPTGLGTRRKKVMEEEERPEKKKTTGKRGKRSPSVNDESTDLFTKGPFSATAVLDEDGEPIPAAAEGEDEENRRAPSSRRDSRKQTAPTGSKVLEFRRPTGKITLSEGVTVKDLADRLNVKASDLMKHLMMKKGLFLSINAPLGAELAQEIARELDIDAELVSFEEALELESLEKMGENAAATVTRAPVITVMGHVDHGKTSLLDSIRETDVAAGEAGGITQHIGAYKVEKRGRKIVFLDTPGHEAFTMMRARGAKVTDIVILVVAADDGVMPQTKEAIDHARAAKVPMIVAINKIDKPNANVERVRRELSEAGVLLEQWGGEVVSVEVSATKKQGIDDLLEMILLTADMLDLKASPENSARGVVLEARKEVGRGIVGTVLLQDGTLKIGDYFFSGAASGRVRAMEDDRGNRIKEAGPATPVSVTGFDDVPNAGDTFIVVDEASQARMIGEMRQTKLREASMSKGTRASLDQLFQRMQAGNQKELNLIVKADVQGSVEVVADTLRKLSGEQVKVNILHASVGAISTNDVLLATASDAIIVGFNVRPQREATELAEKEGVEMRLHTIIYELIDEIRKAMTGLLDPKLSEVFQGRAEVRNTFKVPKAGTIAGCHVTEGVIPRTSNIRLLRDNRVIFEGKIASLRHFKNDVSEVRAGFECGIGLERFQDVKIGDIIEAFKVEKTAAVLQ